MGPTRWTSKLWPLLVALGLPLVPVGSASASEIDPIPVAEESPQPQLAVGVKLVALTDIRIRRARIVKGAQLVVTQLSRRSGRIHSVDVELPDGYVLRHIGVRTIRGSFQIVANVP